MGTKSNARVQRKAEAQARFEASKPALLAKVDAIASPRRRQEPSVDPAPRLAPHHEHALANERVPKAREDGGRFGARMTWCLTRADRADHWSWGEPRDREHSLYPTEPH
nr:hypothetical protein [uncultured Roseateles sp.]